MNISRGVIINIISLLVGSGITVFAITTVYTDFIKQPSIQVKFDPPELNSNPSSLHVRSYIWNFGMIPAHNVTIILHSSTNITYDDSSLYYTENTGDVRIRNDGPNKLIINAPRLVGSGGQIALTEILTPPPILGSHILSGVFFSGNFAILVAYEEGSSSKYYNVDMNGIEQTLPTIFNNVEGLLIILGLFSAVFFYFVPQIYRLVKNLMRKSYRSRIYSQIIRELIVVLETIRTDPATTKIFPADLIDYQEINPDTRSFFYNYEDLRLIGEFYAKLRNRDSDLSTEPNYLTPKAHNAECYRQGLNVLKNIKWRKYGILTKITKKREIISMIFAIFPGAGHIALRRIRRGLLILLSFVVAFVGTAFFALHYLGMITYPIIPSQESLSTVLSHAVLGVIVVWLVIYAWQIIDLRKHIRFIQKVQSYLDL